jgi:hypothetical protein
MTVRGGELPHLIRIFPYSEGSLSSVRSGMSTVRAALRRQAKLQRSGTERAFGPTCRS